MGRSNIKQVAEKRLPDIQQFIATLFQTADEIAHSNLVYTFFHPLLRDQENIEVFRNLKGINIGFSLENDTLQRKLLGFFYIVIYVIENFAEIPASLKFLHNFRLL